MRRMEEKRKKEAEGVPSRTEEELSEGSPEAGQEPSTEEPGYWVGMNPEDSSDTDMNKSRFAVWPGGEKNEETISSASLKKPARITRSSREATEKLERIGHELHGPDEVVLPGGTIRSSDPGSGEWWSQKGGPGGMEPSDRMQKTYEGRHSGEWRIISGKGGEASRQAEDLMKKRQEHDR